MPVDRSDRLRIDVPWIYSPPDPLYSAPASFDRSNGCTYLVHK